MSKKISILSIIILLSFQISFAQVSKTTQASLESVTIYNAGAELNHTAKISTISNGINEVVIGNLSNQVDESSIQVGCSGDVTIMSVKFRQEFREQGPKSTEEKSIEENLEKANSDLMKTTNQMSTYTNTLSLLDENKKVGGANTGLNVADLQKMVEYYLTKTQDLKNQLQSLSEKQLKQKEEILKMQNQLKAIKKINDKSKGELVLQLLASNTSSVNFNISYISPNASWYPNYDLKTQNTKSPLKIIYKANVTQTTGLDWKNVKMTISTANPSQTGAAPILTPWFLNYYYSSNQYKSKSLNQGYMNTIQSAPVQQYDKFEEKKDISTVNKFTSTNENAISATFDIDLPYDITCDGKVYSISMKEYELKANYKYYAVPKKDREAFLLAEITDWEQLNLLPGEANIIFDGTYVGKSFIDPNSTQDTLNLSMGHDKKIVIRREKLVDFCNTKMIGSKKTHVVTYEIKVKNTRKENIDLLLKDQYPISQDKDIEVDLIESSDASINNETGILTWQLNVAPGATKTVRISYSVKFPKDRQVGNLY